MLCPAEVGCSAFGQKKGPDWIPAGALAYEWEWRLLASCLEATTLSDFVSDRRSDEERAVRTEDDTQEDGEGEATHRSTAEGEDDQHHEQRREGRIQRTGERRVQSAVDDLEAVSLRMVTHFFADTVEDDHDVIDGVTDDSEKRRDEVLVDLHGEGHDLPEKDVDGDDHQRRHRDRSKGTDREGDIAEADEDVDRHEEEREADSDEGLRLDVVRHAGAYLLRADDVAIEVSL